MIFGSRRGGARAEGRAALVARVGAIALAWAASGALLIALFTQLPATHRVDVGGYDAAYTQGFYDAERSDDPGAPRPYLVGSDSAARWTQARAALLFPQAGTPATLRLRLRGWRAAGPPPAVVLLLNGTTELARFQASDNWQEHRVALAGGLLKPTDFFVEIRSELAELTDGRLAGVLLDQADYEVGPGPNAPAPAQLLYGALMGVLLWALLRTRTGDPRQGTGNSRTKHSLPPASGLVAPAAGLLLYGLLWLLLYRWQPPFYPYPLRTLPPLAVLVAGALLLWRDGPAVLVRLPAWRRVAGVAAPVVVVAAWLTATLVQAQAHGTLARPGVENDFRVFATRETLAQVFSADGFYNLGYPLLLWLARPLYDGNPFLAGRLLAALSGVALLGGGYWLARTLLPPGPALLALIVLALSGLVAQYGLYVGSDMPFAACVTVCVAASLAAQQARQARRKVVWLAALAGLLGGMAFLVRHLGLILLPWGVIALLLSSFRPAQPLSDNKSRRSAMAYGLPLAFAFGFLLAAAPQLIINTAQAGQPLYNQQAKNIWLAVYGGTDWGRWDEAPNSIGLAEVVLRDPVRFGANWWRNLVAYGGSGAEDTSEFGRAEQLRLLGWPANWLAVFALGWWLLATLRALVARLPQASNVQTRNAQAIEPPASGLPVLPSRLPPPASRPAPRDLRLRLSLLLLIGLYVAAVSSAFALQRFFLPLVPLYAVAAAWAFWRLARSERALFGLSLVLVVVLWGGYGAGAKYALGNQPADELAAIEMVQTAIPPDALLAARVAARLPLAKYSALAHRVVEWPIGSDLALPVSADDLVAARAAGARYLLWDEASGLPPLPDPGAARVASSGRYALYQLE